MNQQLIQAILYANIFATQAPNLATEHMVPTRLDTGLTNEVAIAPVPDMSAFPPPLTQQELLDVFTKTLSDVLTLYSNTTIPLGVAGPFPITATLRNMTSL